MDNISALEQLKTRIRPHLKTFLEEEGIEISDNGMILCINPMHADSNASMKILSDLNNEQLFCYGCNIKGDIFSANHWMNGAPITGLEFIKDNVYKLADSFDIPYSEIELSPEQLQKLEEYSFTKSVSEAMVQVDDREESINWTHEHAEERGWNRSICKKLRLSTVIDYNKFVKTVQNLTGLTYDEVRTRGVTPDLFGPDCLTFTMFDEKGRPVGFSSRWLGWEKSSKRPKYKNSSHSLIYKKSKLLYGSHTLRKSSSRLDIFEGNGSFVTAYQAGHNSCVSLCGSSLTEDQILLIQRLGFSNVNLVLDLDETGQTQMSKYMDKLSGREGLKVSITRLKFDLDGFSDGKDPDDFIRTYSLKDFFKLRPISAFEFFIEREADAAKTGQIDVHKFVNRMIRLIQNTDNRVERGQQLAKLADVTGTNEQDIRDEMERLTALSVAEVKKDLSKQVNAARSTDELLCAIDTFSVNVKETSGSREDRIKLSSQESVENFKNLMTILENKKAGIQGWTTGYKLLDYKISGLPKPLGTDEYGNIIPIPGSIIGIAGAPQHGKSTIMQNIALRVAEQNDDVTVLYWALDDSRERTLERMLSMHSGVNWKAITRRIPIEKLDYKKLTQSVEVIQGLMEESKLILKDHSIGSTLPLLKRWVEVTQSETNRPILLVIDSFHKISASSNEANLTEPAKAKYFSQWIKSFVQTHNVTVMASLEMNKGQTAGREPTLLNITETRKIEFDFDIIATVYNNYYDMDGNSDQILYDSDEGVKPLIKFNLRKSKDGGTGPLYFALDTRNFQVKDYTLEEVKALTDTSEVSEIVTKNGVTIVPYDKGNLIKNSSSGVSFQEPWKT
jgi:DNA primase catalytic core